MLSDEEKKAYDNLIMLKYFTMKKEDKQSIDTILNLIEKQSKEIEELKDFITKLQETKDRLDSYDKENTLEIEKLKKEIEELKKDKLELINKNHVVHLKDVEKELREMRKEIDTKNAEIECLNVIHESYKEMIEENNYISKDKIRKIIYGNNEDMEIILLIKKLLEE